MRCFALVAGVLAALVAGLTYGSESGDYPNLQKCATLPDDENRLACYDGIMRAAVEDSDKPTKDLWGTDPKEEEVNPQKKVLAVVMGRCHKEMQTYGSAIVKACVDRDITAHRALLDYPSEHLSILARCTGNMAQYGWAMVKACADRDIEAERALERMRN